MRVAVIGAGISGLTTAAYIQEAAPFCDVSVISELFPIEDTVSIVAGAIILITNATANSLKIPYERLREMVETSHKHFTNLARDDNSIVHGVTEKYGHLFIGTKTIGENLEESIQPVIGEFTDIRLCSAEEIRSLVPNYICSGWYLKACFVDSKKYLLYLLNKIAVKGGKLIRKKITSVQEIADSYDVVINCTGLGSRVLVSDEHMRGVKGQIIRYDTGGNVKDFLYMNDVVDPETNRTVVRYVLPHSMEAVVGGTQEVGKEDKNVDAETIKEIIAFSQQVNVPGLKNCRVIQELAGVRPGRTAGLRLEAEYIETKIGRRLVIHNYGHGGVGYGLSVGCAQEVYKLLVRHQPDIRTSKL